MDDNFITKELWINVPVEDVYRCFTEETSMLTWHGKEVELNPVPGGIYRVVFENGDVILGEFLEVIPCKKLWYKADYGAVSTKVEVHFVSENEGTTIKLRQEFLSSRDSSTFNAGWDYFLRILKSEYTD